MPLVIGTIRFAALREVAQNCKYYRRCRFYKAISDAIVLQTLQPGETPVGVCPLAGCSEF
jgi:hypothetical protein